MKHCPFCAEDIQDEAVKCRYCGEFLEKPRQGKWYMKTSSLIVAFLCVGPFALPLVWINRRFGTGKKIAISAAMLLATYLLWALLAKSMRSILEYYQYIASFQ